MARPKKNETISEKEVYDVLQFASSIYNTAYSPILVNDMMKRNTMQPLKGTADDINKILENPNAGDADQKLLGYSEFFELTNMLYKRTLLYYSTLLSYDLDIRCVNATAKDYNSKEYKKDLEKVKQFLNRFDIKNQFTTIAKQMFRQEIYVGAIRAASNKILFQELPQAYSLITGRWEYGFTIDFNMIYFYQPGVDINMYPDEFKDYYNRAFYNGSPVYLPTGTALDRNSSWAYWVQTDPSLVWAFKFSPEVATRIPFLAPSFPDIVLQPLMRELQKNANIISASKILAGEVGLKKDGRGGMVQDGIAMTPETLGRFLAVMKSGISSLISVVAAPLENLQGIEYDVKDAMNLYKDYNLNASSMMGNSGILFSNQKANVAETKLAINMDENILETLYAPFEDFLDFMINQQTTKYKFKFKLSGFNTFTDRDNKFNVAKYWTERGFVDLNKISHAMGYNNKLEMLDALEESSSMDLLSKITLLPTIFTSQEGKAEAGKVQDGVGRPAGDIGDISDGGTVLNIASNDNKV